MANGIGRSVYAFDGNGNVTVLQSASGTVTSSYEYGPFGEPVRVSEALAAQNPFRFSTKQTDDITGHIDYGHRDYISPLGRFANRDPLAEPGFAAAQEERYGFWQEGPNPYCFVDNNPEQKIDLLGLQATGQLDPRTEGNIRNLHHLLQPMARTHILAVNAALSGSCRCAKIIDGLRTAAAQNNIPAANTHARGRTSYHVWGLAYDIGIFRLPVGQTDCAQTNDYLSEDSAYRVAGPRQPRGVGFSAQSKFRCEPGQKRDSLWL